jgi:DNA-binding SARP family transcriptional activator/tetratricopeptide (TPR) repeat protein
MNGDTGMLRIQLLGPIRAWRGEHELELGGPRRRAVLGMLAMRASQAVSRSELIDGLWAEDPPDSAVNSVHVYVAGLRRVLEPHRPYRAPGQVLAASGPGYLLRLEPGQVDAAALDHHLAQARGSLAGDDLAGAARSLDAAQGLWQGAPLAGIPGPWADIERVRLDELRLTSIEEGVEVMLALGGHHQAVAQLAGLIREHPLRERFRRQFMMALYRCGRQADALAEFATARRVLATELGIEPGPELRRLHQQILTADTALDRSAADGTVTGPGTPALSGPLQAAPVPRELPADVDAFTGRAGELAELDRLLAAWNQAVHQGPQSAGPAAVVISAVAGSAGVGKTALAAHWAHRVRDAFPDGQLYVNLRGYDPGEPVAAADALAGFLRALGVAGPDIPADMDERAARYRSLLDGRRMLVLLDNAASTGQVRPLLPGSPSCLVVVTSRDSLAGLVARHGARRLDLDLLPPADAVTLLRSLIGARVDADPAAAATLAGQCARLPLALRVAAEFAAARPALTLAQLVGELASERRRLDLLDAGGDPRTAVRSVFSWSYRHLPAAAARMFRQVGLHPGPDLDTYAAAALAAVTLDQARDLLGVLARAHLILPARPGRHGMHDLLRAYAADLAATQDTAGEPAAEDAAGTGGDDGQAALTRLFDYYLAATAAAMDALVPAERDRRPRIRPAGTPVPPVAGHAAALAWLDAERATLVAVSAHTATRGWPGHATRLSSIVRRYLETGGHYTDAAAIHSSARRAAGAVGDLAAEAQALNNLGLISTRMGQYQQAGQHLRQSMTLFRTAGDRSGAARALANLGFAQWRQGRYAEAASQHQQALALFREIGETTSEAHVLNGLGLIEWQQGGYPQAASHFRQALTLFRAFGDRSNEAHALGNLGMVSGRLGSCSQAAGHLTKALALLREMGDRSGAASVLTDLGSVACQQGRYQEAARHHQRALALFREIGERTGEAEALNGLGEVLLATGQPGQAHVEHAAALTAASQVGDKHEQARARNGLGTAMLERGLPGQARAEHAAALNLASRSGDRYEQARALGGLARGYQSAGDLDQACDHWRRALAHYTDLGVPEADDVRTELAALSCTSLPGLGMAGRAIPADLRVRTG